MSQIFEIADQYVEKVAEMSPLSATYMGVPGHDHRMNDFSPEASDAEAELDRATLSPNLRQLPSRVTTTA